MSKPSSRWVHAVVGSVLFLLGQAAIAGSFAVTPVRLYMSERDRAVAVTVVNEGTTPVVLQADFFRWNQNEEGADVLTESDDLILSPPVLRIPPLARQVVRVARLRPSDRTREATYRMVIREVPPDVSTTEQPTLRVALAFSLPLFVTPAQAKRVVTCEMLKGAGASPAVDCMNSGSAYAQIRDITLVRAGQVFGQYMEATYVLPGVRRRFQLKPVDGAVSPGPAQLRVTFDDNKVETFDVAVGS